MNTKFYKTVFAVAIFLILVIFGLSIYVQNKTNYKEQVTHDEIMTGVLEKGSVKVFYKLSSSTQKDLAEQGLDIIYNQYEICSNVLNLSFEELHQCSMVFCENYNDPYFSITDWHVYVDDILCWPIVGEDSMNFKNPLNEWMLYFLLPHEILDISLRDRDFDAIYAGWFIEGAAEYTSLMCAKTTNQINSSYFLNRVEEALEDFSKQEERIVNLSNRDSFTGFGAPSSEDEYVFYVGSLTYIYDLVDNYGDAFVSDVVANNCTSYEEIRSSIENSTGYNISDSIMNVSVSWIKQRYISILDELNVDYK